MIFSVSPKFSSVNFKYMEKVCDLAEEFLNTRLHVILNYSSFSYTQDSPEIVFNHISSKVHEYNSESRLFLLVTPWKSRNPWSSAIGQTTELGYEVNLRRMRASEKQLPMWVGNAVHEFCHHPCNYSHPFFNTTDRGFSVPYVLGSEAASWIQKTL